MGKASTTKDSSSCLLCVEERSTDPLSLNSADALHESPAVLATVHEVLIESVATLSTYSFLAALGVAPSMFSTSSSVLSPSSSTLIMNVLPMLLPITSTSEEQNTGKLCTTQQLWL